VDERDDTKPSNDTDKDLAASPVRMPWETPMVEELAVQLSANNPTRGRDGLLPDSTGS
jgi:hypothetical protein